MRENIWPSNVGVKFGLMETYLSLSQTNSMSN